MKKFASLFQSLEESNKTNDKVNALASYFKEANNDDKLWTIALLSHRRPKRTVKTSLLRLWAAELSELPTWLFESSYHIVGDLAETIALVLPKPTYQVNRSLTQWIEYIKALKDLEENEKKEKIIEAWLGLDTSERFLFNKIITGGLRIGVSQKLMTRALSKSTGIEENTLMHRLMGDWTPDKTTFQKLILEPNENENISQPYPFYLAYALDKELGELGSPEEWQVEYKWDGIRGQIIIRENKIFVWSRGEDIVTHQFPEYHVLTELLPNGTVLDGEIICYKDKSVLSFNALQKRLGRKKVGKKLMQENPVAFIAYDLLEWKGKDMRMEPLAVRRSTLETLVDSMQMQGPIILSEKVIFNEWNTLEPLRANARANHSEGLMIKRKSAIYHVGRKRGDMWKWKVDPLTIDAVMLYAQRGHGRRANLFSDFTFAVWNGDTLVPFAKAYSGLTDEEFNEITKWVRQNTIDRYGPVNAVVPQLVFEIAFEGIQKSSRHKSGIALRFPRIKRWRKDKHPKESNTLADLQALLEQYG
ncbi:MAG: ATP-dependent DNA ligase [Bacteroidota bacterium]